jgi:hypothetical protein
MMWQVQGRRHLRQPWFGNVRGTQIIKLAHHLFKSWSGVQSAEGQWLPVRQPKGQQLPCASAAKNMECTEAAAERALTATTKEVVAGCCLHARQFARSHENRHQPNHIPSACSASPASHNAATGLLAELAFEAHTGFG